MLWNPQFHSTLHFTLNYNKYNEDKYRILTYSSPLQKNTVEREYILSNDNSMKLSKKHELNYGATLKYLNSSVNEHYGATINYSGVPIDSITILGKRDAFSYSAFITHIWKPHNKLTFSSGLRLDYFDFTREYNLSPRFSLEYKIGHKSSLSLAAGIYTQNLPMVLLVQDNMYWDIQNPETYHYIVGFRHFLNESTLFQIEAYDKEYRHCPTDPSQPYLFILDQTVIDEMFLFNQAVRSKANARSYGLEILIQKKLSDKFYGMICGSWFRSHYQDYYGNWHNRIYDNRYTTTLELGYQPNKRWEFNLRWYYAGGRPYTPFFFPTSGWGHWNSHFINSERFPDYRCYTIRVDRKFNFSGTSLALYTL